MVKFLKHVWDRRVIYYIILVIVACPLAMVLGAFTPENLRFLEPVLCPPGMHLDRVTETQTDLRGTVVALDAACTDGEQRVDVTGRLALFVCGTPVLIGILLVLPAFFSPGKKKESADYEE
ncbi:MAG: hypothetical protein JW918_07395 [Anaerolineae bacterium]|nr:hypothetical protein [Anaerolineae bacterium]